MAALAKAAVHAEEDGEETARRAGASQGAAEGEEIYRGAGETGCRVARRGEEVWE